MGKFRVEAVGLERQSDVEKGFQPFREEIAPFEDEKNAIASAKACVELYADDLTIVVVEKREKRWYTHFTVKGKADTDKHASAIRSTPLQEKVAGKIGKTQKKGKKVFDEGNEGEEENN